MDNTYYIREIQRIYDDYLSETIRLEKDRKVTEGLMGFGQGLGSAPCHDQFTEKLEQMLTVFMSNVPSSDAVADVLAFMYDVPLKNKDNTLAYLMLKAVHTLTEKLIALLTPEAAAALSAMYREAYPKSERLPAQKKIAAQLQAQAGESGEPQKRSLLDIFKRRNK
jgi:hypothetical protein